MVRGQGRQVEAKKIKGKRTVGVEILEETEWRGEKRERKEERRHESRVSRRGENGGMET